MRQVSRVDPIRYPPHTSPRERHNSYEDYGIPWSFELMASIGYVKAAKYTCIHSPTHYHSTMDYRFDVAFSFASSNREKIKEIAEFVASKLGKSAVFYDDWYQAEILGPDMYRLLQRFYCEKSLVVVSGISGDYADRSWCQAESKAIEVLRFEIDSLRDETGRLRLLEMNFDDTPLPSHLKTSGVFNGRSAVPECAATILRRLKLLQERLGITPRRHKRAPMPAIDEEKYARYIRSHYNNIHLDPFSGGYSVENETGIAPTDFYHGIRLPQIFISQQVRDYREFIASEQGKETSSSPLGQDFGYGFIADLNEEKRLRGAQPQDIDAVMTVPSARCRVLLGAPGSGKSSFARMSLLRWYDERVKQAIPEKPTSRPLPILIELRAFNSSGCADFFEYIENHGEPERRFKRSALEARLKSGSVEMIFDGLDEIFEREKRTIIAKLIIEFAREHESARNLITSRPIGYDGLPFHQAGFTHWLLVDFDGERIDAFIDNWANHTISSSSVRQLFYSRMKQARRNPLIRQLARNPLLLTLMAVLARKRNLPHQLRSIYNEAAELLLKHWDVSRALKLSPARLPFVNITSEHKRLFLSSLAWKMQTGRLGNGNLIDHVTLHSTMEEAFAQLELDPVQSQEAAASTIQELVTRSYILSYVGDAQFAFIHRGFLEFFSSEKLVEKAKHKNEIQKIRKIFRKYSKRASWREVLILAGTGIASKIADRVLCPLTVRPNKKAVATAACYRDSEPFVIASEILAAVPEPLKLTKTAARVRESLERWIHRDAEFIDGDGWVNLLIRIFPDERTQKLLEKAALKREMTFTRLGAIIGLCEHFRGEPKAGNGPRETLLKLARRDRAETRLDVRNPRKLVAALLAKYFPDGNTLQLLRELGYGKEVADWAVTLDEYFGPDATRARLTEFVLGDEDSFNREEGVRALAERFCEEESTRVTLIDIARRDEVSGARAQAIASLAEFFFNRPLVRSELLRIARTKTGKLTLKLAIEKFSKGSVRDYLREIRRDAK